jgi:adenylate cyclase
VELLLRRHLVNLSRPQSGSAVGYESQYLVVGFVDLVGSTALAAALPTADLSVALSRFESTACDLVVGNGGRVVKLIGDEIMFTAPDAATGLRVARALVDAFEADPVLPPVRAGLAAGDVLTRDGDCFGPVVNLASRIVGSGDPGEILLDAAVGRAGDGVGGGDTLEPLEPRALKGFAEPVPLLRVRSAAS